MTASSTPRAHSRVERGECDECVLSRLPRDRYSRSCSRIVPHSSIFDRQTVSASGLFWIIEGLVWPVPWV